MRSKHTGQVGNSTRFGVGGGNGLRLLDMPAGEDRGERAALDFLRVGVSNVILLTKTTWQI
jgi:hypothetical protein